MSMLMCWQHMKDTATSEQAYELTKMTMPRMKMILDGRDNDVGDDDDNDDEGDGW